MTAWAQSLIRISNYEVETLQKRLADINERRAAAEMDLQKMEAELRQTLAASRARAVAPTAMGAAPATGTPARPRG